MAQNAGSLGIQITADDAELRAVMKRAAQSTTTAFDKMSSSAATFKTALAGLGVGLSAGYFVSLIQGSIDAQARMKDFALEAGTTASAISRFETPARLAGLELDTVAGAMFKLSKAALEAKDSGSASAQALNAIGISAGQLKGLKPDELFELIARQISKYSDGLEKNAVMMQLFGKSGREMNRVIEEIASTSQLQATMTDEQANAADRLQDEMVKLRIESEKLQRTFAAELVPTLSSVLTAFNEGKAAAGLFEGAVRGLSAIFGAIKGEGPAAQLKMVEDRIKELTASAEIARTKPWWSIFGQDSVKDAGKQLKAMEVQRDALRHEISQMEIEAQNKRAEAGLSGKPGIKFDPSAAAAAAAAAKKAEAEATRLAEQELRRYITAAAAAEEQALRNRTEQAAADDVRGRAILAQDEVIQSIERETAMLGLSNDERELAIALRSIETSGINKQDEAYGQLAARLQVAIKGQQDARARHAVEMREQMELLQNQSNFVGAFEDGLASFIDGTKSAKDAFKDFVRSVEQQLARLAAQDIANSIFGNSGGGGSGGFFRFLSSFAGLFGGTGGDAGGALAASGSGWAGPYANGGVFGPAGVHAFAMGDVFGSPTRFKFAGGMGVMGEAGPEAVMPLARDRSGRLGVRGGGTTVNQVTFNISTPDANSFRQSESQIAATMYRALSRSARSR